MKREKWLTPKGHEACPAHPLRWEELRSSLQPHTTEEQIIN